MAAKHGQACGVYGWLETRNELQSNERSRAVLFCWISHEIEQ